MNTTQKSKDMFLKRERLDLDNDEDMNRIDINIDMEISISLSCLSWRKFSQSQNWTNHVWCIKPLPIIHQN